MKKLETEKPKNGAKALKAFWEKNNIRGAARGDYGHWFEHGQLWIVGVINGGQWSVVDAEGPGAVNGFDFECITDPQEDY